MEPAIVGALAALMGSVVGGAASIATAWLTQRTQSRRETLLAEIRKRETLYAEFIGEASRLAVDSLDHTLDRPTVMLPMYAFLNRIRLVASEPVLAAAELAIKRIVEQYFNPNLSIDEIRAIAFSDTEDPLRTFAVAARTELKQLAGLR